jgi:hypothetical protein
LSQLIALAGSHLLHFGGRFAGFDRSLNALALLLQLLPDGFSGFPRLLENAFCLRFLGVG